MDPPLTQKQVANISAWLNENPGFTIFAGNMENLKTIPTPSFQYRADKLLLALEKKTSKLGQMHMCCELWWPWAWCIDNAELTEIIEFLHTAGRITNGDTFEDANHWKITPTGWLHLEEIRKVGTDSQQGFVAMWFDPTMTPVYDSTIAMAIADAGYRPHRVDCAEHNNKIDDEIIAQIRRSRFVVADFTGHRAGVYYEAGFAQGLRLEVIWTCRKDEIEKLHFDVRQYNCIDWSAENLPDFRTRLTNRIERVLGKGSYRP